MKQVVRYQCGFCKKLAVRPETILKHEKECIHNPDGRNCFLCKFSVQGGYVDTPFGEQWQDTIPYCQLEGLPLMAMRETGHTALNCAYFARDDKMYHERNEEDVQREIDQFDPF